MKPAATRLKRVRHRAARKCLATAKPLKEEDRDSYSVFCGEEIFTFGKVNGAYKFTDIGVNDRISKNAPSRHRGTQL